MISGFPLRYKRVHRFLPAVHPRCRLHHLPPHLRRLLWSGSQPGCEGGGGGPTLPAGHLQTFKYFLSAGHFVSLGLLAQLHGQRLPARPAPAESHDEHLLGHHRLPHGHGRRVRLLQPPGQTTHRSHSECGAGRLILLHFLLL